MAFKKRYILAEEAEERIVSLFRKENGYAADIFNTAIDACQTIILDMYDNATDTVEVVRCKDCKYGEKINQVHGDDVMRLCHSSVFSSGKCAHLHDADWFCADGERRTDAEIH